MESGRIIHLKSGNNRDAVELICIPAGQDFIVYICGGKAHIGAVGVGYCYDREKKKANSSVIAIGGHREDELVKKASHTLAKELGLTVSVIAGIHYDQLSESEIERVMFNVNKLIEDLVSRLSIRAR